MTEKAHNRLRAGLFAVTSLGVAAAYLWWRSFTAVFSGMAAYDDEGYMLVSLASFLERGDLYESTYTQYGPGYFAVFGSFFDALNVDLTSLGTGRWVTLGLIVAAASLGAFVVWLATEHLVTALASQLVLSWVLVEAAAEPLHPGHLLVLLLGGVAVCCLVSRDRWSGLVPIALGSMVGLIGMIKINVGVLTVVGLALGATASSRSVRLKTGTFAVVVLIPALIVVADPSIAGTLAPSVMIGMIGFYTLTRMMPSESGVTRGDAYLFVASGLAVVVLLAWFALATGTSSAGLLSGVILEPLRLREAFSVVYAISPNVETVGACAVLVAAVAADRQLPGRRRIVSVSTLKILGGLLAVLIVTSGGIRSSLASLILLALLAVISAGLPHPAQMGRRMLVGVAILQPLQAYPVAGSQIVWGSYLLVLVSFIVLGDGLQQLATEVRGSPVPMMWAASTLMAALLASWVLVWYQSESQIADEWYETGSSPETLAGLGDIRLDTEIASRYSEIVGLLQDNCDAFYSIPGMNSFHILAAIPPITGANATTWPALFAPSRQAAVVEDLKGFNGRLCVLRNDPLLASWQQDRSIRSGPLVKFVDAFETEAGRVGDYVVLTQ